METKNIFNTIKHWTGMIAIVLSVFFYACGSDGSSVDNTTDVANGSDMDNAGDDPADTLSIGGSSDGRPSGAGPITDSVGTAGVRMDSIQNNQSGTNSSNYGNNANNEKNNGMDANKPGNQDSGSGGSNGQSQSGNKNKQ